MATTSARLVVLLAAALAVFVCQTSTQTTIQDKCCEVTCPEGQECKVISPICRRCPQPQPKFAVCVNITA